MRMKKSPFSIMRHRRYTGAQKATARTKLTKGRLVLYLLCEKKYLKVYLLIRLMVLWKYFLTSFIRLSKAQNFALDNNMYGDVLTYPSKVYDCLPYQLAINNVDLDAYSFNRDACILTASYFTGRKQSQRVRLCGHNFWTICF